MENIKLIETTRNFLAHAYMRLSPEDLEKIVREILPKAEAVARSLEIIVEEKNINPEPIPSINTEKLAKVFERNNITPAYFFGSRLRVWRGRRATMT